MATKYLSIARVREAMPDADDEQVLRFHSLMNDAMERGEFTLESAVAELGRLNDSIRWVAENWGKP